MDDVVAILNKLIKDAQFATKELDDAVLAKKAVEDAATAVRKALEVSSRTSAESAYTESLRLVKEAAPIIYKNNAKAAATASMEYAFDSFLVPLLRVGDESDLYSITATGSGWNKRISVELMMNEVAGNIQDYADAVESVREFLGVKEGRDPALASSIWKNKIYGKGPYYRTIKDRLRDAVGAAPFWSLLNDGSKNVRMSSDIGGTPYPSRGGHHFVEKTETELRDYYNGNLGIAKYQYDKDVEEATLSLEDAKYLLGKLQKDIDRLSRDSELIASVASSVGVTADELSASKIIIAANKVRRGELLPPRIRIGAGTEKRIRYTAFSELVGSFGE